MNYLLPLGLWLLLGALAGAYNDWVVRSSEPIRRGAFVGAVVAPVAVLIALALLATGGRREVR